MMPCPDLDCIIILYQSIKFCIRSYDTLVATLVSQCSEIVINNKKTTTAHEGKLFCSLIINSNSVALGVWRSLTSAKMQRPCMFAMLPAVLQY